MISGRTFPRGISAAILVGGLSKRLGRDKVLLKFEGEPLIRRSVNLLTTLFGKVQIIGHHRPEFAELGVEVIEDIYPGKGSLGGLYTAVESCTSEAVFVQAADMPFVNRALIEQLLQHEGQADAVIPRGPRGFEPLCALYSRSCSDPMKRAIEDGTFKIMAALGDLTVLHPEIKVEKGEQDPFANINFPEDWERLEGRV